MAAKKPFWEQPAPKGKPKKLSPGARKAAAARAAKAGRRYPNLVDNAWAAKRGR